MIDWLVSLDWSRLLPEVIGKFIGFLLGFAASWFLLFRKRLKSLERLRRGDSDDVLFQAHFLHPTDHADDVVLLFRNIVPSTTIDAMYHNQAARDIVRTLAAQTSLKTPILQTTGSLGFSVLNDAFGYLAGHLALVSHRRPAPDRVILDGTASDGL